MKMGAIFFVYPVEGLELPEITTSHIILLLHTENNQEQPQEFGEVGQYNLPETLWASHPHDVGCVHSCESIHIKYQPSLSTTISNLKNG